MNGFQVKGQEYFYHQVARGTKHAGPRTRLPGVPYMPDGTPNDEWWAAYRQLEGEPEPAARAGTYAALIKAYQASPEWGKLSERTRKEWDRHLRTVKKAWGHLQVRATEPKHVKALRNAFADIPPAPPALPTKPLDQYINRPAAADNLLGALAAMLKWSIPEGWRTDNPCRDIPKLGGGEGYSPWSKRVIDYYRRHGKRHLWWVSTVALYTGQRQSDVVGMLKSDVRDGRIRVLQDKTGKELWIPIHRDLQAVLDDMAVAAREAAKDTKTPRVSKYLLVNTHGTEWTQDGFRASWQTEMARREFKPFKRHRLVFHGLRKSATTMLLEAGCTDGEVASITGMSRAMIVHYSAQVNQRKLAKAAILKWEAAGSQG